MKKTVIFITVICILMSCTGFVSASYDQTTANDLSLQLSFYDSANTGDLLTRAEFANILCALTDADEIIYSAPEITDMDLTHPLYPAVARAINLGYFKAPESGLFKPDDGVYAYQAVSTLVDILGYRPVIGTSDYLADWAYGSKLGLLDGIETGATDFLSKDQMSLICRNALDVDIMKAESFGRTVTYRAREGVNLLCEYHDAQYITGIVGANSKTGLMSASSLSEDEIMIGNLVLKSGMSGAQSLLGYEVECWYSDKEIIYIEKTNQNKVLTVSSANLDKTDKTEVVYLENDKEKKLRLSPEADFIYNNSAVFDFDEKLLSPSSGYISFLDNNGDGKYDVIFINEYTNYFVLNFNTTDLRLTDGIRNITADIDPDDKNSVEIYSYNHSTKTMYPASVSSIYRKNIVSAQISLDGENVTLVKSDASVSGTVKGISVDSAEPFVTIDGNSYKVSKEYIKFMNEGKVQEIALGKTGIFYLDYTGTIAYADFTNGGYEYGYMTKAKGESGLDNAVNIRLFNDEGKWITYHIEDKIRINGSIKELDYVLDVLSSPQIIKYRENSDGVLQDIHVFEDMSSQSGYCGYTTDKFTRDYSAKTQKYKSKDKSFAKKYGYEVGNTNVFIIPANAVNDNGSINEDEVFLGDSAYFINDKSYDIDVYDSDEFFIANVIVVTKASEENYQSRPFLVNKVTKTYDENGDEICIITGYLNGALCRYMYDKEDISGKVCPGDVLRVALANSGEIRLIEVVASLDPQNTKAVSKYSVNTPGTYGYNTACGAYIGTAYNVDYKRNTLIAYTSSQDTLYKFVGSGNVFWIFDTKEKEFVASDISCFEGEVNSNNASKVFVFDRYLETKEIVVIK